MEDLIKIGDIVSCRGNWLSVRQIGPMRTMYQLGDKWYFRYEFQPLKWLDDIVGNTGIGVCAKNGSLL